MAGKSFALTERDRAVLLEVNRFGLITREQLMRLKLFSSKTRANERLKTLTDARYLQARPQPVPLGGPRFVYLPGPLMTESRETRRRLTDVSDLFLAHQLGLIDTRLAFERDTVLRQWSSERELSPLSLGLIPDAYLEYAVGSLTFCAFVEYDRGTETLGRFERKAKAYADLAFSGKFERLLKRRFFRVFVITDSANRLDNLSATIGRTTTKIFWLTTLRELAHLGPLASIWRRPGVPDSQSLTVA
jgi:protein involved in plasmid replication-relaxation